MTEERPSTLRRRPRPAADETIDPIDPRSATPHRPQTQPPGTSSPTGPAAPEQSQPAARSGREITVQLGLKVSPDVVHLLDLAIANARANGERLTMRAAVEQAVRNTWG